MRKIILATFCLINMIGCASRQTSSREVAGQLLPTAHHGTYNVLNDRGAAFGVLKLEPLKDRSVSAAFFKDGKVAIVDSAELQMDYKNERVDCSGAYRILHQEKGVGEFDIRMRCQSRTWKDVRTHILGNISSSARITGDYESFDRAENILMKFNDGREEPISFKRRH